jgi:hypothetical protein
MAERQSEDTLVQLCGVLNDIEGHIIRDLLESGGISALYRSGGLGGYGMITANLSGGAGEVLVHPGDLAEARRFLELWQKPLLEEAGTEVQDADEPDRAG